MGKRELVDVWAHTCWDCSRRAKFVVIGKDGDRTYTCHLHLTDYYWDRNEGCLRKGSVAFYVGPRSIFRRVPWRRYWCGFLRHPFHVILENWDWVCSNCRERPGW